MTTTFEICDNFFSILSLAKLGINPDKCVLERSEAEFLGYTVSSEESRSPLCKAIDDFPRIATDTAPCRFLGMLSFYRRCILRIAGI